MTLICIPTQLLLLLCVHGGVQRTRTTGHAMQTAEMETGQKEAI